MSDPSQEILNQLCSRWGVSGRTLSLAVWQYAHTAGWSTDNDDCWVWLRLFSQLPEDEQRQLVETARQKVAEIISRRGCDVG